MGKADEQVTKLTEEVKQLQKLLDRANSALDGSSMILDYHPASPSKCMPFLAEKYGEQVKKHQSGNPLVYNTVAFTGACLLGFLTPGALLIDGCVNTLATQKIKRAHMGYYNELVSKQSMIIAKQQEINREMARLLDDLQDNEEEYREKLAQLTAQQEVLSDLLDKISKVKAPK